MRLSHQLRTAWRRTLSAGLAAGALFGTVAFGQVGGGGGIGSGGGTTAGGPSVGPGVAQNSSFDVKRPGALGVSMSRVGDLRVTSVYAESVAERAGVQMGDRILAVNGQKIISTEQLSAALSAVAHATGNVTVTVERAGRMVNLSADFAQNGAAGVNGTGQNAGNKAANLAQKVAGTVERTAGAVNRAVEKVENVTATAEMAVDVVLTRALVTVSEVRAKVITDVEGLDAGIASLADGADKTVKNRIDAAQKKLDDVKEGLRGKVDETDDQIHAQLDQVREKLEGVRTDLDGVAEQTTGTAREAAQSLSTRVNETIVYLNPKVGAVLMRLNDVAKKTTGAAGRAANNAVDSTVEATSAKKGRLGVSVRAAGPGVALSSVDEGSVAARAGLQPGDQLLKLNGAPIANVDDLRTGLGAAAQADGRAVFEISRSGQLRTIEANFGTAAGTASRGVNRPNE